MKIKNKTVLRNLVVLGILGYLCSFGSFLCDAQKQKKPQISSQRPPKQPRLIPFRVHGRVLKDGKGAQNIRIKLVRIQKFSSLRQRGVKPPEKITDKNGRYSFAVAANMAGQKYKLIPKHANLPAGRHFIPGGKEFTLTKSMTVNFKFRPPPIKVKVISKNSDTRILYRTEVRLHQVRGPHQFRYIESKKGGICKFELDFDYIGKNIRVQPRHLRLGVFGVGFNPKEERFKLTGARDVNFIYNGPLPDLTIASVDRPSSYIIVTIKNLGNLGAGKFMLRLTYNVYNLTTKANPSKTIERVISGVEAGGSKEVSFFMPPPANSRISLSNIWLDIPGVVIESDERNNKWRK